MYQSVLVFCWWCWKLVLSSWASAMCFIVIILNFFEYYQSISFCCCSSIVRLLYTLGKFPCKYLCLLWNARMNFIWHTNICSHFSNRFIENGKWDGLSSHRIYMVIGIELQHPFFVSWFMIIIVKKYLSRIFSLSKNRVRFEQNMAFRVSSGFQLLWNNIKSTITIWWCLQILLPLTKKKQIYLLSIVFLCLYFSNFFFRFHSFRFCVKFKLHSQYALWM